MQKHAYLIAAHNEFYILKKLISLLDHKENDLYVHVDKNVSGFNPQPYYELVNQASIQFIDRIKANHGGYSLIAFELALLKEATKIPHQYYHLLSGVDLPIKSHGEILKFFNQNQGKEFLGFDPVANQTNNYYHKLMYYQFLRDFTPPGLMKLKKFQSFRYRTIELLLKLQEKLKINRIKHCNYELWKGDQWFSITHDFAKFVLAHEREIKKMYQFTLSANEVFMQTLAMNSHFRNNVVENSLRFIDWKRGSPYTFTLDDFELLNFSDRFWARKFSIKTDKAIVDKIYHTFNIH
jgi:hypothetical protein